mmetsp:Transcript_12780/g.40312  ORF Transcript_12780/g.40312 Transcript_12780/m.40312 type:complete len:442 (+) Transcript_12780:57-1382(+)
MRLAGSLPRRKSLSSLVLRQDRVSARVQLSRRRGQRAVDKDVLAQRSVEAGGERVALEPIVDGDVELAGSGKALHLVEPVGGQEERGARRHLDGHDVRVPEERVAVVVGVRDVGEGEVVHLSARQPRLELARARSDKVLHQHHRGVGCVQPGRVDESEALGSRNLQQHRILPVVVQNRRLGRGRHPQVARLQRGRDELLDKGRQRREAEVGQVSRRGLLDSDVLQRRDDPLRLGLRVQEGVEAHSLPVRRLQPPQAGPEDASLKHLVGREGDDDVLLAPVPAVVLAPPPGEGGGHVVAESRHQRRDGASERRVPRVHRAALLDGGGVEVLDRAGREVVGATHRELRPVEAVGRHVWVCRVRESIRGARRRVAAGREQDAAAEAGGVRERDGRCDTRTRPARHLGGAWSARGRSRRSLGHRRRRLLTLPALCARSLPLLRRA